MLSQVPWTLHLKPTSIYFVLQFAFTSIKSILLIKPLKFKTTNAPLICCFISFLYDLISFTVPFHLLITHLWILPNMHRHSFFYQEQHIFRSEICLLHVSSIYTLSLFSGMKVIIYHIIEMHQLSNNWDIRRGNSNV